MTCHLFCVTIVYIYFCFIYYTFSYYTGCPQSHYPPRITSKRRRISKNCETRVSLILGGKFSRFFFGGVLPREQGRPQLQNFKWDGTSSDTLSREVHYSKSQLNTTTVNLQVTGCLSWKWTWAITSRPANSLRGKLSLKTSQLNFEIFLLIKICTRPRSRFRKIHFST